jgi:septal ring factor EnvC (AmiA/AmiB activator)
MLEGLEAGDVSLPVAAFRGSLPWPLAGKVKVPFGRRKDAKFDTYTLHNGIEIDTPAETPVHAVHEATVVFADRFRGYGLMVVLDHGHKHHTLYAHLAEIAVQNGQRLPAGHVIGATGAGLEGNGLYFEVRFQGKPEDPLDWLKRERDRERR